MRTTYFTTLASLQVKTTPINRTPKFLVQMRECDCPQLAVAESFFLESLRIVTVCYDTDADGLAA